MEFATICNFVSYGFAVVCYVVLIILAVKRKIKSAKTDSGAMKFDDLLGYIVSEIKNVEEAGSSLSGKSGFFKFETVLSHAKDFCRDNNIEIDTSYLTERIEALVKLMNFKEQSSQLDTEAVTENTDKNFKYIGVK